jgi:predicted deacylase
MRSGGRTRVLLAGLALCAVFSAGVVGTAAGDVRPAPAAVSAVAVPGAEVASPTPEPTTTPEPTATPKPWESEKIGESVRGRAITAYRFGTGSRHLLILGGVHGNERGDDVALALVRYLKAHPSAVPSDTEIHIIPVVNPDGVARHTRGNAHKVDLNRNLPTSDWRRKLDRRDVAARAGLTGGKKPASEPETKAMLSYSEKVAPEVMISLHSRAKLIDYAGPGAKAVARRISKPSKLRLGHLSYDAYIHGSGGQYYSEVVGIPAITVELWSSKLSAGLRRGLLGALG